MKCKMCPVHMVAGVLTVVGALNWGLVGLLNFNLVNVLFGNWPIVEKVVYILVGLSALVMLLACSCKKCGEACQKSGCCTTAEKKM